jgi:hypothetical protein
MSIREGGRLRRMRASEVLVRTLLRQAFKDPKALSLLLILIRYIGYGTDQEEDTTDILLAAQYEAIARDFIRRNNADNSANTNRDGAKGGLLPDPKNPKK